MNSAAPAMTGRRRGGAFLAGAGGRLLPASVPFRWFGAAVVFHALAWLALAVGASSWPSWRGGLGWPLAALHLVTLGTLVASAIGASLQLLPVATRQAVRWPALAALMWWAYVPGVALLALGMAWARPPWLALGAALVLAVLVAWAVLLALNLRGARGMPAVVLHGWGALAGLALLALSALALVALWNGYPLLDRERLRALHLVSGVFGLMGLLVLGLSTILLPMFTLAAVPDESRQRRAGAAALAAVALAALAALPHSDTALAIGLRLAALCSAALALGWHLRLMRQVLQTGLRRNLGRSGWLMHFSWGAAALALVIALAKLGLETFGGASELLGPLFVLAAVGGWLASFLFAVLQRILPFLASMHAARGQLRPPTPSALTLEPPLQWHLRAHVTALGLLAVAIVLRSPAWLVAAAVVGFAGALAFGVFFAVLMLRLRGAGRAVHRQP